MSAVLPEPQGRYLCPVCGRRFWLLPEKKAHLKLKHPRPAKVKRLGSCTG